MACASSVVCGCGGNMLELWRYSRDGGQPHGLHGPTRFPGVAVALESGHSDRVCSGLPGTAGQHDGNAAVSALASGGTRTDDSARYLAAADLVVRPDSARGLRSCGILRASGLRDRDRIAQMHRQARVLGAGRAVQCRQTGLDERRGRLRQRGRGVHRLHDARVPRQVHAVHGDAAWCAPFDVGCGDVWQDGQGACGRSRRRR